MAATQQAPDRIDSVEPLTSSLTNTEQKTVDIDNSSKQPPSTKNEKVAASDASHGPSDMDLTRDVQGNLSSSDPVHVDNMVYPQHSFAPQAQSFYGGYDNSINDWEGQSQFLNLENLEVGQTGIYENPSLVYTGYGYSPQMPYGPYSPVTTPLPSINGDGHLYSTQQFQFPGPYYQQPSATNIPYISSATPIPQADWRFPIDQQGAFPADNTNFNAQLFSPRPGYQLSYGSFGGDWLRSPDVTRSATPLLSPAASPQPMGAHSFGQSTVPFGMGSQQQRSSYGFGSSIGSVDRGYPHAGVYHGNTFGTPFTNSGIKDWGAVTTEKGRRQGIGSVLLCNCNGTLDFLNEQNRGPRANRAKNQMNEKNPSVDNPNNSSARVDHILYNSPDFMTDYKDARFFIIKSYTEDNVHKSIKYGVWASTSNGNRKLDSAYHEAKKKEDPHPVFLFFSVNASAQFCGVAEMIGPVDFEKSVDYWQQDKWNGQFPVKWHIVKDVPNNMFRHIILENNDNKPVTNSRDTQEVKLEQGLEMLNIFKKHEYEVSILDDFEFYEEREKAMQERKALQQQLSNSAGPIPAAFQEDQRSPAAAFSGNLIEQISKNFAHTMRLEEISDPDLSNEKTNSSSTGVASKPDDTIKPATLTPSS
ncbi:YTH domain-containing protein ECT4-like isoform X2 [Curcuma longa]|uniref:YTH domain-containing protein ECT4-like isoform X2 n=1 Tax=Curcuma longa TaxID=136217 RepID=UPI003D9E1F50